MTGFHVKYEAGSYPEDWNERRERVLERDGYQCQVRYDIDSRELQSTGFVLHTLQTALCHALMADSAEAAIVNAVNEGGDTDTIGAVAGAVAGARFGASALPERWLDTLTATDELRDLARAITPP